MILRQIVEQLIDADVECGARTPVRIQVMGMPTLRIKRIDIEDGETGTIVWIDTEEA